MAATVKIFGAEATCRDGAWGSADPDTAKLLNAFSANRPSGPEWPDRDAYLAGCVGRELGAEVTSVDEPPPPVPGRVY